MFLRSREVPMIRADNLTAICEQIVQTMWESGRLTALRASRPCTSILCASAEVEFLEVIEIPIHCPLFNKSHATLQLNNLGVIPFLKS
jgi:hypothetical protein